MSAWIVSKAHIDIIVRGLIDRAWLSMDADEAGRMLWAENLRSVAYRYPNDGDGERPGPTRFRDSDVETYTYTDPMYGPSDAELDRAIGCYSYQSCEHPEWEESDAYEVVECARRALGIPENGGSGPWGWEAADIAKARVLGHAETPGYMR